MIAGIIYNIFFSIIYMIYILISILIIIILILIYEHRLVKVTTIDDGQDWYVADYANKLKAAKLLSRINSAILEFMRYLKKKYHISETVDIIEAEGPQHSQIVNMSGNVYNIVDHFLRNYNPEVFYENDPKYSVNTSYTVDKGAAMYICLRDRINPYKIEDDNTVMFTILHECSHMANYLSWDHDEQFWTVFKFILYEATLAGVYIPIDYSKYPVNFCGLRIEYQPLYDNSLLNLWNMN